MNRRRDNIKSNIQLLNYRKENLKQTHVEGVVMLGLSVKEMIFGGVTVINTGLGITNMVLNCKNRRDIKDLRAEVNQFAIKVAPAPAPAPAQPQQAPPQNQ